MTFDLHELVPVLPEITLLIVASVVLLADLYIENKAILQRLTIIGLLATIGVTLAVGGQGTEIVLGGTVVRDAMGDALKVTILVVTLFVFIYSRDWLRDRNMLTGEYYVLVLFGTLGMLIMVASNSFLTLYLGLELLALCLYALVAFDRDSGDGAEAAMKYFVLGALGSGMLLYGMSMLYGATGSLDLTAVGTAVAEQGIENKVLVFGLVFVLIGIGFKFGAVPFHMWVPDVYQGAPTPVVLFLGSAPKVAAFAMAVRLLVDGMSALQPDWQGMLVILSVFSMGLGNLIAIAQKNIKRMLAYSTISHVGFIFLGLLAANPELANGVAANAAFPVSTEGLEVAMFYAMVYAVTAAGAFGVLLLVSSAGHDVELIDDLKGLNDRHPWLAAMMALVMFSMAGVPPTVGFMAKLLVLEAVISVGYVWLAVVAVAFSIIGAFYYLRVVKAIYFDKPEADADELRLGWGSTVAISVNGLAILLLGIFPAVLLGLCRAAFA